MEVATHQLWSKISTADYVRYSSMNLLALVHLLSRSYVPAAYPRMSLPKHSCYFAYSRYARSGCHSWLSFLAIFRNFKVTLSNHQVVQKFTYTPHAACGYRIELQRKQYTEQRTTENNIQWKISIWLTSVGRAHARPNHSALSMVTVMSQVLYWLGRPLWKMVKDRTNIEDGSCFARSLLYPSLAFSMHPVQSIRWSVGMVSCEVIFAINKLQGLSIGLSHLSDNRVSQYFWQFACYVRYSRYTIALRSSLSVHHLLGIFVLQNTPVLLG